MPEQLGEFSLLLLTANLYTLLLFGWVKDSFLRFYNENIIHGEADSLKAIVDLALVFINLIFIPILIYLNNQVNFISSKNILYLIVLCFLQSINMIYTSHYRLNRLVVKLNILEILPTLSIIILFIAGHFYHFGEYLSALLKIFVVMNLIVFVYNVLYGFNVIKITRFKIDKKLLRDFIAYGAPLILVVSSSTLNNFADRYIIDAIFTKHEVGLYSFSYDLSQKLVSILPQITIMTIWPIILKVSSRNEKASLYLLKTFFKIYMAVMITLIAALVIFSHEIIIFISSEAYHETSGYFPIIVIGNFISSLAWYINAVFLIRKNTRISMFVVFITAVINISLNILFLPTFGYKFAASATLISSLIYLTIFTFYELRYYSYFKDVYGRILFIIVGLIITVFIVTVTQLGVLVKGTMVLSIIFVTIKQLFQIYNDQHFRKLYDLYIIK